MTNPSPLDACAIPPKVAHATKTMQRLRDKYVQDLVAQHGIPPGIAKTIVYTYKTPKHITPAIQMWTGKCAITGIALSDRGSEPTSAMMQPKRRRFISNFADQIMRAVKLPEDAFIMMCAAVYNTHYGNVPPSTIANKQSGVGRADSRQPNASNPDNRTGSAEPADTKRYDLLGVHVQ